MTPVSDLLKHETMAFCVDLTTLEAGEHAALYTATDWIRTCQGRLGLHQLLKVTEHDYDFPSHYDKIR